MREVIRPFNARMRTRRSSRPSAISMRTATPVIVLFDARGIARDGEPYVNSYAWFLDMRAGRIIRATAFFDAIAFNDLWMRIPPPPKPWTTAQPRAACRISHQISDCRRAR